MTGRSPPSGAKQFDLQCWRCRSQIPVERRQRQAAPLGELEIGGIIPAQEAAIVRTMNSYSGATYRAITCNCATAVMNALGSAGIGLDLIATGEAGPGLPKLPTTVSNVASQQPGATTSFIRPSQLNQFNPSTLDTLLPPPTNNPAPLAQNQSTPLKSNSSTSVSSVDTGK